MSTIVPTGGATVSARARPIGGLQDAAARSPLSRQPATPGQVPYFGGINGMNATVLIVALTSIISGGAKQASPPPGLFDRRA